MDLAARLTDTPTLGLTPRQRRWLGVGAAAAMLAAYQAYCFYFLQVLSRPEGAGVMADRWAAALAALGASAIALTCAVAWERGRGGVLAPLGAALALAGLACGFSAIAAETSTENVIGLWQRLERAEAPSRRGRRGQQSRSARRPRSRA